VSFLDISEVSDLLGLCHFLKAPKHIFITRETVSGQEQGHTIYYRGLQPKTKHDAIFLASHADETTPIHETIHTLGFGEFGAEVLTRAIMRKNKAISSFPLLKQISSQKPVYQKVTSSKDYPDAHTSQYAGRVEHYVLASYVEEGDF